MSGRVVDASADAAVDFLPQRPFARARIPRGAAGSWRRTGPCSRRRSPRRRSRPETRTNRAASVRRKKSTSKTFFQPVKLHGRYLGDPTTNGRSGLSTWKYRFLFDH